MLNFYLHLCMCFRCLCNHISNPLSENYLLSLILLMSLKYYSNFTYHTLVLPIFKIYKYGIIQYILLYAKFFFFTQHVTLKLIYVGSCNNSFFFILLCDVSLYEYITICLLSFVDGHPDFF